MKRSDAAAMALARLQHGVITSTQAYEAGLTRRQVAHRLDTGLWLRVLPRTFLIAGAPWSWNAQLMAHALWSGGAVSHRAAAQLHKILVLPKEFVELTAVRQCRVEPPVIFHRTTGLPEDQLTKIENIPVTNLERTILDLPQVVHPKLVSAALDIARRTADLTLESQQAICDRESRSGRNGLRVVRAEVARRDPRLSIAQSSLEDAVFQILNHPDIPAFERHVKFKTEEGFDFELDLYWSEHRKGGEADHFSTHGDEQPFNRDRRKINFFLRRGIPIMHFTPEMTRDPARLRRDVLDFLCT